VTPPILSFTCSSCGELHEGAPSFGFAAPAPYLEQPEEVRQAGQLGSDLCRYRDADGEHFFIRVCLEVPIQNFPEPFIWGVWVSLGEESFHRYIDTYDAPHTSDSYFGWLCSYLPWYERTYGLKTRVQQRGKGTRPCIVLEESDHPLCRDFHRGMSRERATEVAQAAWHSLESHDGHG
jgi:hypothetical protein